MKRLALLALLALSPASVFAQAAADQICISANLTKTTADGTATGASAPVSLPTFCAAIPAQADQNDLMNAYRSAYGQVCATTNGAQTCVAATPTQETQAWAAGLMQGLVDEILVYRRSVAPPTITAPSIAPAP